MDQARHTDHGTHAPRIAIAWALVSIPLAYGLYNAVEAAAQLFTG